MSSPTAKLTLFTEWREEYRQRRYLERTPAEELHKRAQDLLENAMTIGPRGEALIIEREEFRRKLAHVYAEYSLRKMTVPTEVKQCSYRHYERATQLWSDLEVREGSYLLKFGNAEYMIPMFETGRIRVSNAKWFEADFLGAAIRDCEIRFEEECYEMRIEVPPYSRHNPTAHSQPLETIGNVKRVFESITDYYMACFGLKYDLRLFDDFSRGSARPYDACLVITEPVAFFNLVRECGEERLPGWFLSASSITYHDPYYPTSEKNLDIFFVKHFRYAYQHEFRMIWMPPQKEDILKPVDFVLGSLHRYCKLLVL